MPSKDSKKNFALLRDQILQQNGKDYWRSVEEYVDAPEFEEFIKGEFPAHAEEWDNSLSRRNFIKVMGASLALAGLAGCTVQPSEKIVPYVTQPAELVPGRAQFFATAMTLGGVAVGLLGTSNEGRPTKIEGNPEHPGSVGTTDLRAQASLLDLYDPDRSKEVTFRGEPRSWQNFMTELRSRIEENRADGGAGVRFLTETVTSPTLIAQFDQIRRELPNAKWVQYEPVNQDNATAGAMMAFGSPVNTVYRFDQAERILSLDKDIFADFNVRYTKDYIKQRNYSVGDREINRLYMIETTATITGAKADHRLAVKPSQMVEIAQAVAAAVGVPGAVSNAQFTEHQRQWIVAMAKDLAAHRGRSLVVAGDNQLPMVHALAHAINQTLGNVGTTVVYTDPLVPFADTLQIEQLRQLIQDIDAGAVKMLVILSSNPVYTTPIDLKLNEERMNKIPFRVHLGRYQDETSVLCHWHVSEKHYLEMWSDARAYDGTVTIVQPLIKPLYDSKSIHEVVQLFLRENYDRQDYDILRDFWQTQNINLTPTAQPAGAQNGGPVPPAPQITPTTEQNTNQGSVNQPTGQSTAAQNTAAQTSGAQNTAAQTGGAQNTAAQTTGGQNTGAQTGGAQNTGTQTTGGQTTGAQRTTGGTTARTFEDNWRRIVHDGLVPNSAARPRTVSVNTAFLAQPQTPIAGAGGLEIAFRPDPSIYDGRFANNGWLQELPKYITLTTWENVALVSPATAKRLGLNQGRDDREMAGGELGISFITTKGGNLESDLVRLRLGGAEIPQDVPVWVTPGHPDDVVTVYLGYGRTRAGRVGNGLGYNAYEIRRSDAMWFGAGELATTGGNTSIASTQIHFNMEGRDLLLVWNVESVEPLSKERHELEEKVSGYDVSMYGQEHQPLYERNYRWGMTIDLNNCVGCNACVVACQAENNIPVVGKEQVERSREMHWLRIDHYYTGDIENPDGPHFQPVLCQQCELAPCEVVCPVHATVHSAEGLNDMVYNRCVGTRYCSNNCPYKVRRFNFLLYQDWDTPQFKMMRNPEVTVRSRGVMEKCTYCTQRISIARIESEKQGRRIQDGEVVTACQAVCPADAIIFGDLNDHSSRVAQTKEDPRNYTLLFELNTQPRTTYLANVKNQNHEMPDYRVYKQVRDKIEVEKGGGH